MRVIRSKEGRDPKDKWKRFNLTYNGKFNAR